MILSTDEHNGCQCWSGACFVVHTSIESALYNKGLTVGFGHYVVKVTQHAA